MLVVSLLLIAGGLYLFLLMSAPTLLPTKSVGNVEIVKENKIIIDKINVNSAILEGNKENLDKGVWHRFPERGNPEMGGNFVLTGHRFKFAPTPVMVKEASVFYNVDKLVIGDEIIVHWNGRKYVYKIQKLYRVNPSQTEIENVGEAHMTLYTCTLAGSYDGREVVEAKLVN